MISWAHVGAYKVFQQFDHIHLKECLEFLNRHLYESDKAFAKRLQETWEQDSINLIYGRDFLKERKMYDIVVVHSVFEKCLGNTGDTCRTSLKHTPANWRRRLIGTQAKYIFICTFTAMCFSGYQVGEIPGYDRIEINHRMTVYQRKETGLKTFTLKEALLFAMDLMKSLPDGYVGPTAEGVREFSKEDLQAAETRLHTFFNGISASELNRKRR